MKCYIIRQEGVYWHNILFVGLDKDCAVKKCKELALRDSDSYHNWVVSEFTVGATPEQVIIKGETEAASQSGFEVEIYRTDKKMLTSTS